jgi:GNAT superfamily N-acetyltransferase
VNVREIGLGDKQTVVNLARLMHAEAPAYRAIPFEPEKVAAWATLCAAEPDWICLLAENDRKEPVGFAAAGCVPLSFSDQRTVDDLGLYVLPEYRGSSAAARLVDYLTAWSKAKGAIALRFGLTTGINDRQATAFLQRMGFTAAGVIMVRDLLAETVR